MKALRKNIYAFGVITLFIIAAAMLILFLTLFSSSTAVDGTTVGSVWIGDKKPNTDARKQKLLKGINDWQTKKATYTISFQNVSFVIGDEPKINEETGEIEKKINQETGEEEIVYISKGLNVVTFDYDMTNSKIIAGQNNLASFDILEPESDALYAKLVKYFGPEVTDKRYFDYVALKKDIVEHANNMDTIADFDLYDYINGSWRQTEVAQIDIENLTPSKISFLTKLFEDEVIEFLPQKDPSGKGKLGFSAVEYFSNEKFSTMSSSDMSIIATGLAAVVMETSLTVTVKNQGYETDREYAYLDVLTARVHIKDNTDLRIINPETHSYYVKITSGPSLVTGNVALKFVLEGCRFVNEYSVKKDDPTIIAHKVVYDEAATSFTYDPTRVDENGRYTDGEDPNTNGGCYYRTTQFGEDTYLYGFTKTITYVDGRTDTIQVFPKQEFFSGKDEKRAWMKMNA